jgi:hypothetical protein
VVVTEGLGDGEGEDDDFVGDGVDFGEVGVEVLGMTIVPPPEPIVALAEGVAEGDADGEAESEGSATLEAPVLLPDVWACDVIVDTDAADDFGDPPLVIM